MRAPSSLAGLLCTSAPGLPIAKRSDFDEISVQGAARVKHAIFIEALAQSVRLVICLELLLPRFIQSGTYRDG